MGIRDKFGNVRLLSCFSCQKRSARGEKEADAAGATPRPHLGDGSSDGEEGAAPLQHYPPKPLPTPYATLRAVRKAGGRAAPVGGGAAVVEGKQERGVTFIDDAALLPATPGGAAPAARAENAGSSLLADRHTDPYFGDRTKSAVNRFLHDRWAPFLMRPLVKVLVLAVFFGYCGFSAWCAWLSSFGVWG